jgi:hypothetical protein
MARNWVKKEVGFFILWGVLDFYINVFLYKYNYKFCYVLVYAGIRLNGRRFINTIDVTETIRIFAK